MTCFRARDGPAHQKPPGIRSGQLNIIVPLQADRFNQNAKVQQSLVQPLRDILGVAAVQVIANVRVFPGQGPGGRATRRMASVSPPPMAISPLISFWGA